MVAKINGTAEYNVGALFDAGLTEKFNNRAFKNDSHEMNVQEAYERLSSKMDRILSNAL